MSNGKSYLGLILLSIIYKTNACTVTTATGAGRRFCAGDLIFDEEFNHLDSATWRKESTLSGGGNWEFQWYTSSHRNSYTKNGRLYIKPSLTSDVIGEEGLSSKTIDLSDKCTDSRFYGCSRTGTNDNYINPIRSAKLTTINSFSFKYGKVEIRAKLPTGDWLWPALWLLPKSSEYGEWPRSGEIDLMEGRGNQHLNQNGVNIGTQQVGETLHWGPEPNRNAWSRTHFVKNDIYGFNNGFHTFGLEWTPDKIIYYVDGQHVGTVDPGSSFWNFGQFGNEGNLWSHGSKMAPFDKEFYIILNLAVGGTNGYFPDNAYNPHPKPWSNTSPRAPKEFWQGRSNWLPTWDLGSDKSALQVDYVKVWAV